VWPGFGDNSRVLKWIAERLEGRAEAVDTAIGRLPTAESLDLTGLSLTDDDLDILLTVDPDVWREEAALIPPPTRSSAIACPGLVAGVRGPDRTPRRHAHPALANDSGQPSPIALSA